MPGFTLLPLVTRPALGKRPGLRGPALALGFQWLGVQRHLSVRLALWLEEVQGPTHPSSSPRPGPGRAPGKAAGDGAGCARRWGLVFPCIHSPEPCPQAPGGQSYLSLTAEDS